MRVAGLAAIVIVALAGGTARADDDADAVADRAFRDAEQLATRDPLAGRAALEALGAARPISRWTDDAWTAAARLADRAGDYDRARVDLGHVLEVSTDDVVRRRATAELARLATMTGATGQWSAIAAQHDALAAQVLGHGDPKPALAQLDALLAAHPDYPRADAVRLVIATGWERDGELAHAIDVLDDAVARAPAGDLRGRALLALVRAQIRHGALADADATIAQLAANPGADPTVIAEVRALLDTAHDRARWRLALLIALALIGALAVVALRRSAASWRAAVRSLVRPPSEVLFVAPIALVFVIVAATGNPLVGRAVRLIAIVGVVVTWVSGAIAEAMRRRHGRLGLPRALGHAACAALAVIAATYVIIDHDRMIDLVAETWRTGPTAR